MTRQPEIKNDISFEEAIVLSEQLLADPNLTAGKLKEQMIQLLQTSNGARGFWVTFLTGESPLADQPPHEIIEALEAVAVTTPQLNAELMVKNLVMSTAMAITHQRRNDPSQVAGSQRVAQRSLRLLQQWQSPIAQNIASEIYFSATTGSGSYANFLQKWGYDQEQLGAITNALTPLLTTSN
jgi:hypothetical protein